MACKCAWRPGIAASCGVQVLVHSSRSSRTYGQRGAACTTASLCQSALGIMSLLCPRVLKPHLARRWRRGAAQQRGNVQARAARMSFECVAGDLAISMMIPTFEAFLLSGSGIYTPLWLIFGSATGPNFASPEVKHGVVLAACWLSSASYARAYEGEALDGEDPSELLWRLFTTNFLNAWLIFFAVSFLGLFEPFSEADCLHLGIPADTWGSAGFSLDAKVIRQVVDVNIDILVEALLLNTWHVYYAGSDFYKLWSLLMRRFGM
ncbi:benK [Symbiodinium natans]|uniref:BenK protein n=1 Tax=Symbiodinium natans TaxID=878477 RepID=A0A812T661_9DINO|nr:benK [Symbiodinium natans]